MERRDYYEKIFFEIILMIDKCRALNGKVKCLGHEREIKRRLIAKFWRKKEKIVEDYLFPKGKEVKVSKKERNKMFQGYLSTALYREMLDFYKKHTKEPIVDSERTDALLEYADQGEIRFHRIGPEEACAYEELVILVDKKISKMSKKKRSALLVEMLNKSKAGYSEKDLQAHNSNLYRARKEMADYLRKLGYYISFILLLLTAGFCVGYMLNHDGETAPLAVTEVIEIEVEGEAQVAGYWADDPTDDIILAGHWKDEPTDSIVLAAHWKGGTTDSIVRA